MINDEPQMPADNSTSSSSTLHGVINYIDDRSVSGWCLDIANSERKVALEVIHENEIIARLYADKPSSQLKTRGIGDGRYGFEWTAQNHAVDMNKISIRIAGSGSFLALSVEADHRHISQKIRIEMIESSGILGWVDTSDNSNDHSIQLYLDDHLVASSPIAISRDDVIEAGYPNSCKGFHIPVPEQCFNVSADRIRLSVDTLGLSRGLTDIDLPFVVENNATFYIHNGELNGWYEFQEDQQREVELRIFDNNTHIKSINLSSAEQGKKIVSFSCNLATVLEVACDHNLTVNVAGTRTRLRNRSGQLIEDWKEVARGKIERWDHNIIKGWAFSIEGPDAPSKISLYDGDELITTCQTVISRPDTNKHFGIGGTHGFELVFPASLYDNVKRRLSVKVEDVQLPWAEGNGFTLTPEDLAKIPARDRYQGKLEVASSGQITGWAFDRKRPETPVELIVEIDDQPAEVIKASRFQARLRSDVRSGHHAFTHAFRPKHMNGKTRKIAVRVVGAQYELPGSPARVLFPLIDYFGTLSDNQRRTTFSQPLPFTSPVFPTDVADSIVGDVLISIIVLNWNGDHVLRPFLNSLLDISWKYSYELIIVDHGSEDSSLGLISEYANQLPIKLIARGANYSFSASNNRAAAEAKGNYLVIANNDLIMLHDCFASMVKLLQDETLGVIGVKLLEPVAAGGAENWDYVAHHQGIRLRTTQLPGTDVPYYGPVELHEQTDANLAGVYRVPAVTGALFMCRTADYHAVGGFDEGYIYGMEDVDFCFSIQASLGKAIVCDTRCVALHNRSATRDSKLDTDTSRKRYSAKIHNENRTRYVRRYGRAMARRVLQTLARGDMELRSTPLRVTFIVTEAFMATAAGDFFTAVELADACRDLFGWEVMFATMQTYSLPGTDVVIVMRHDYHIEKVTDLNPGAIVVAWVRNRVDQWLEAPHFLSYHIMFASSSKAADVIKKATGRNTVLLPIATNAKRFKPLPASSAHSSDVVFTGNYWGAERESIGLQDIAEYDFAIYGHKWDQRPEWAKHWRGAVPYPALPEIYSSSKVVLDDSHPVTREWDSLNSRVFDALGCGKLVLTNCEGGAKDVFPNLLPSFQTADELRNLIQHFLSNPEEREQLAAKLHHEVLEKHTYHSRAKTLQETITGFINNSIRFAIKIGVPRNEERDQWGDYHFAKGLQRAIEDAGHIARIDILPDWYSGLSATDEVVIVMRGLSQYQPQPTAINLAWIISHPDDISISELKKYDHVFVASSTYTEWLSRSLGDRVSTLLQCTDPNVFFKDSEESPAVRDVIFVGNSRGQQREVVQYAVESGIDFEIYGGMWEGLAPHGMVKGTYIPNSSLRKYYSTAKIVLNDHWPDMREHGFISNRVFDAGACGAVIISDEMAELGELFGESVAQYSSAESLREITLELLNDDARRKKMGNQMRTMISKHHTFAARAREIISIIKHIDPRLIPQKEES